MTFEKSAIINVLCILVFASCISAQVKCIPSHSSDGPGTRTEDSLKLVFVISRHGNRGGAYDYPLDPYPLNNTKYWPYGALSLTPYGRVQAHNLGIKLRALYNGFLPQRFYSDDIFATTDLCERDIMTAQLVLAGLYPPKGDQVWDKDILWQPIAVYTNSSDHTISKCPRNTKRFKEIVATFVKTNAAAISKYISEVYKATGVNVTDHDLRGMFDKLICEDTEGYVLPTWTNSFYPKSFIYFFRKLFLAKYADKKIVQLLIGNMFDEIIVAMKSKINNSLLPDRKMIFYSAHDTTVVGLQVAFGVPMSKIRLVKAGSALIIELHKDQGNKGTDSKDSFVQVLYIDGSSRDLEPIHKNLPKCGDPCNFNTLLKVTSDFANVDYEKECQQIM